MEIELRKFKLIYYLLLLTVTPFFAQQSYVNASLFSDYNNALKLFNSKAYAAAQQTFKKVKKNAEKTSNLETDAAYYEAMCAVKLKQTDADKKVLIFVKEHPNSNKKNKAFFNVANYYFANKRAAYALKWFLKVDIDQLSKENKKELNFKTGYALLSTNNLRLAKKRFLPLINDAKYGNDARYYYGYLAYKLEDYGIAESTLKEIADNASYKAEISYYLLDISFKAGKFERCVTVGKKLLKKAKKKEQSNISKIIGESYFNLKKYTEAIPYLKNYRGKKGKWNNTDYYQLGFAYYKQNHFEKAISNFNKILDEKNKVAQNAYYNLAECYLKVDKKTEALNAFKAASEMDFDKKIKEDAALNYAKLSYDEGNPFKSVADVLQDYLKTYPKSTSYSEINNLVVNSYILQQDYEGAFKFLSQKKSKENNELILEVALYRGIQLYQNKQIEKALPFFTQAKQSANLIVRKRAQYWEAESEYQLKNYNQSLSKFIIFKQLYPKVTEKEFASLEYNIGYCYFELKEYKKAIKHFNDFTKQDALDKVFLEDALIRLGDSYFATSSYSKANKAYQQIIDLSGMGADYAQYQIGMSFGYTDQNDKKIKALKKVVNDYQVSELKDDALFQLGNTYAKIKNNPKAHLAYERILEKHSKSIFIPKTLIRQGLLFYNDGKNESSLKKYKQVVSSYPNSSEAFEAVANARKIYIDDDNIDAYLNWIKDLKFINVTNSDIDNTTFAAVEKKYFENKNKKDVTANLIEYTRNFPSGIHKLKANYYLAETLFKQKNYDQAIPAFKVVLAEEQNEFSEESLSKLSQIYLYKENFNDALPLLDRLELEANSPENITYAQSNLMKGYFETKAFDFAIEYGKKILLKDKLDAILRNDAKLIIARASFKTEDLSTAKEFYNEVEKNTTGEVKAEALFYNAYFKNKNEDFEESNKVVQKLIAKYSNYKYWGVKSYVIMAKNYYGLNDAYQATYVLENIIKNFGEFEDIIEEAKTELNKIKINEAKTNNSVTPKTEKTVEENKN